MAPVTAGSGVSQTRGRLGGRVGDLTLVDFLLLGRHDLGAAELWVDQSHCPCGVVLELFCGFKEEGRICSLIMCLDCMICPWIAADR